VSCPRNNMSFVGMKMDRLEKQPTDLRRKPCYFGDRTPEGKATFFRERAI
jgi:hypothetical protein